MRLIDADKFDAVLSNIFDHLYESGRADLAGTLAAFADMLKKQPTIDAVPVVRCKDCKWAKWRSSPFGVLTFTCELLCADIKPDDFCSHGERKDGDG